MLILCVVLFQILLVASFLLAFLWVRTRVRYYESVLRGFFMPVGDGQPSPMAQVAEQFAAILAAKMFQSLDSRLRGMSGGLSHGESQERMAAALQNSNMPSWLPLLAAILPKKWAKTLVLNSSNFLGGGDKAESGNGRERERSFYNDLSRFNR